MSKVTVAPGLAKMTLVPAGWVDGAAPASTQNKRGWAIADTDNIPTTQQQ